MIPRILTLLVEDLVNSEKLVLQPEAGTEDVVTDLLKALKRAPPASQASPFIAEALMASKSVDELYAQDKEIREMLTALNV